MKHTLETLLALAESDDGRQQIRVIVAELAGKQVVFYGYDYQYMGETCHAGSWATRETAEMVRTDQVQLKWKTSEIKEVLITDHLPHFHTSLDAIMPEVRKLDEGEKARFLYELERVCMIAFSRHFTLCRAMLSAEPIHHCISFILTKQP